MSNFTVILKLKRTPQGHRHRCKVTGIKTIAELSLQIDHQYADMKLLIRGVATGGYISIYTS